MRTNKLYIYSDHDATIRYWDSGELKQRWLVRGKPTLPKEYTKLYDVMIMMPNGTECEIDGYYLNTDIQGRTSNSGLLIAVGITGLDDNEIEALLPLFPNEYSVY